MTSKKSDAPAIHCAQCHAIEAAKAAAKAAGVVTRAAQRAQDRADAAATAIMAARPVKANGIRWRRAILIGAAIAAAIAIWANAATAADAPVYHVAEIETADGRIIHGLMADESACLAFTRAIALYVARADCITLTGAPQADYIPPRP